MRDQRTANGLNPIHRLRSEMDRLFGQVLSDLPMEASNVSVPQGFPALRVWETSDAIQVESELPGLKLEDLEIVAKGNVLTISGSRNLKAGEGESVHRRERWEGKFERALRLPVLVDSDRAEANFVQGVLTISLPKSEASKPRRIEVKRV